MPRRRWVAVAAALAALACPDSGTFGRFVGSVKTEWVEADRRMRLLDDFVYVAAKGTEWKAPKGSLIDGASIPRVLGTAVGSPFTGEYRTASVVHDVACEKRHRPWKDVHRMFYEASRCGGVGEEKAKIMYAAVYHFGPRWSPNGTLMAFARSRPVDEDFARLKSFVESEDPTLDAIEGFDPARELTP
jgi:hypothetical protein